MTKKYLKFEVVDHYPEEPYQASWSECGWTIKDSQGTPWTLGGYEGDATEEYSKEVVGNISVDTRPLGLSEDLLLKTLATALNPELAFK